MNDEPIALTIALIGPFAFVCAHGQLDDRAEDCWRRSTLALNYLLGASRRQNVDAFAPLRSLVQHHC